jgi:hypothetical protein
MIMSTLLRFRFVWIVFISIFSFTFISCGSDEENDLLPINDVTLKYGQEWYINEVGNKTITFGNDFIASFKDGKLYGDHVGQTSALTSDGRKFNVYVKSTVTIIKDLEIDWDKDEDWYVKNSPVGILQSNGNYYQPVYSCQDASTKITYAYSFKPDSRKLKGAGIFVPVSYVSQLADYLKERFISVSTEAISDKIFVEGFNAYTPDKATMAYGLSIPNISYYQVTIINPKDATTSKTRSLESELRPVFENLIND